MIMSFRGSGYPRKKIAWKDQTDIMCPICSGNIKAKKDECDICKMHPIGCNWCADNQKE